jgi:hypothetical protein
MYFNNTVPYGLRDKMDQGSGLQQHNPTDRQYTLLENTVAVDTRNCIGVQSLKNAQTYANVVGKRASASGFIVNITGLGVYPPVITFDSTSQLRNDDIIVIQGVSGNTAMNGQHQIYNIVGSTANVTATSNGNYKGGGLWTRPYDYGYPQVTDNDSRIIGNEMIVSMNKKLKFIRDFCLFHIVIPRDIIPLYIYLSNFISVSTTFNNVTYTDVETDYTTFIPQEKLYLEQRILGFYSSPLDVYRSYNVGSFAIPDAVTPPPLTLWNPPGPGAWPDQPLPYPYQTVPTYRSNTFVFNAGVTYYIVLAGYGVYDLVDWTADSGDPVIDAVTTAIMRRLLLILICPIQSYKNVDYIDLILNCAVTSNADPTSAFGFGDFQRYVPGPGLGQYYQPNTNATYNNGGLGSGPPNVVQLDSPIPFPSFNGNVWGPYDAPGDRFQKVGVRSVLQDLYLNGDLNNLNGVPIITPTVPTNDFQADAFFGLNFSSINEVNLGNINQSSNINIINAMRIYPNGFGAASIRGDGNGTTTTNVYESAGGIGPSSMGAPSTWAAVGVYGGAGSIDDPLAEGPAASGVTPATALSTTAINTIINRISFTDFGSGNGQFITNILKYINFAVNDIPDTDLVVKVDECLRDERCQAIDSFNGDAILDCPIRLNIGSTSGTQQYIESLQSLIGNASGYWSNRYFNSKSEISKLHIKFFAFQGQPIPLERMLQLRNTSILDIFVRVIKDLDININDSPFSDFLFDPLNPHLIGRMKRYISIIFKINAYEGSPPGLEPNSTTALPYVEYDSNSQFS